MKKIKLFLGLFLIVFVGFIAFGLFSMPKVNSSVSDLFSAERVASDIQVISRKPHSIEHPQEREEVRQYLVSRLSSIGGAPEVFRYDSIESKLGGYMEIGNVYCVFEPEHAKASSYVMFVAHLDSRYAQKVLTDTVYSLGAADDGYGLGVSLEALRCALQYRDKWKQGVKILFTDAEEGGLNGMKSAYDHERYLFDNVGLIFNIEARGVKGPALLFETSDGNSSLMDLYKEAGYPATYSLTSAVYKILPNYTDFTVIKDSISGMNFSVIADLDHYHTDKDNFDNINLKSIQHYGAQIIPMLEQYLTGSEYSDPGCFRGSGNDVFFTVPGIGLFKYPQKRTLLYISIIFAMLCLSFAFNMMAGGMKLGNVFKHALFLFLTALVICAAGEGIAYLSALISGAEFKMISTKYIPGDEVISIVSFSLMVIGYIIYFLRKKGKSDSFVREEVFGAMIGMMVLSFVLYFIIGEAFFITVPLAIGCISMIFYRFVFFNLLALPALLAIELLELSFLYVLYTAVSIGSMGIVLFIAFYMVVLMTCLFECYMNQKR